MGRHPIFAMIERRARVAVAIGAALRIVARLGIVASAVAIAHAEIRLATILGVATAAAFGAQRLAQSVSRRIVERDVYRATAREILAGDVMSVSDSDAVRDVFHGTYHAIRLVEDVAPALVADAIASVVVIPFAFFVVPSRVIVVGAAALLAVIVGVAAVRRLTRRLEARVVALHQDVVERLMTAIEGRLEIVARGGEEDFAHAYEELLERYEHLGRKMSVGTAVLGRAPLAFAVGVVLLFMAVDDVSRRAIEETVLRSSLVLAACLPSVVGLVLGIHAYVRTAAELEPFRRVLAEPRRSTGAGTARVELPAVVEALRLSFAFEPGSRMILDGVSFTWSAAEPLVLIGENGSGKSTLLKLLLGMRPPTSGTLCVGGVDLGTTDLRTWRRRVSYLPQQFYLGAAHVSLRGALALGRTTASDDEMTSALEAMGISLPLEHRVGALSAGQRQRVALARISLEAPAMVLLDEPDANLDAAGAALVAKVVKGWSARGVMIAVAAHSPELAQLSDAPLRLDQGTRRSRRPSK